MSVHISKHRPNTTGCIVPKSILKSERIFFCISLLYAGRDVVLHIEFKCFVLLSRRHVFVFVLPLFLFSPYYIVIVVQMAFCHRR